MKRSIFVLLLTLLLALALVACTTAADEPTETTETEDTTGAVEEEAMEEEAPAEEEAMEEEEPMEEEAPAEEEAMEEEAPTEEAMEEEAPAEEEEAMEFLEGCEVDLTGETITIHQHAGREGPLAAILGDAFAFATEDALEDINNAGGICGATLEVVFRETNYDVDLEVAAYEEARAADPKPFVILTYGSGATIALNERVIEDQIVNIAAGLNAEAIYIPRDGYTVSGPPIYSDQFAGFVEWAYNNWSDIKPASAADELTVCVIGWAGAYGTGAATPEALDYIAGVDPSITVLPLEEQPIDPAADATGLIQSCLLQGANIIWNQNLSFSVAQVIGTARALGVWEQAVWSGVNWTNNIDVVNIMGENAALMDGYYAMFPYLSFSDTDHSGVQQAIATFESKGYPESDRSNTYLTTYASFFNIAATLRRIVNEHGLEGVTGENYLAAITDPEHCTDDALGYFPSNYCDGNRSGRTSQIRRAVWMDDHIEYVVVEDFFELPDTKPPAPE